MNEPIPDYIKKAAEAYAQHLAEWFVSLSTHQEALELLKNAKRKIELHNSIHQNNAGMSMAAYRYRGLVDDGEFLISQIDTFFQTHSPAQLKDEKRGNRENNESRKFDPASGVCPNPECENGKIADESNPNDIRYYRCPTCHGTGKGGEA